MPTKGAYFLQGRKMSRWITYDIMDFYKILPSPGCYCVYLDDCLVYIGQSRDLRKRLVSVPRRIEIARYSTTIITPWGKGRNLYVKISLPKKYGDWAMRELRLIHRLQPQGNCVGSVKRRRNYG